MVLHSRGARAQQAARLVASDRLGQQGRHTQGLVSDLNSSKHPATVHVRTLVYEPRMRCCSNPQPPPTLTNAQCMPMLTWQVQDVEASHTAFGALQMQAFGAVPLGPQMVLLPTTQRSCRGAAGACWALGPCRKTL